MKNKKAQFSWHPWWAWHVVYAQNIFDPAHGEWAWMRTVYRRRAKDTYYGTTHWEYCIDDFQMIRIQSFEAKALDFIDED